MIARIIEIVNDGRHLSVERGFMRISHRGLCLAKIPLDDIAAVIACSHGLSYSNYLLVELAKRRAVFLFCDDRYVPVGILWPVETHHLQSSRIEMQIGVSQPRLKQLWKQVVKEKIAAQARVLQILGLDAAALKGMGGRVKSGDAENVEAQAARLYWRILFGPSFQRDRHAEDINRLLNYGYMVLRSAVARALMATGLHPSLGMHHKNMYNALRLVDDVMEPFRPHVDIYAHHFFCRREDALTPEVKKGLVSVLDSDTRTERGIIPLRAAIQDCCLSLFQVYEGSASRLSYPKIHLPLGQKNLFPEASLQ